MGTTHALQLERSDDVGGQFLDVGQGDAHHAVRLRPPAGPVLKLKPLIFSCFQVGDVRQSEVMSFVGFRDF